MESRLEIKEKEKEHFQKISIMIVVHMNILQFKLWIKLLEIIFIHHINQFHLITLKIQYQIYFWKENQN